MPSSYLDVEPREPAAPDIPLSEVVVVIGPSKLVDDRFQEWVYWRRNGGGLVPGYYVVTRQPGVERRLFNEEAHFRGPFRSREEAEAALAGFAIGHVTRHRAPPVNPSVDLDGTSSRITPLGAE